VYSQQQLPLQVVLATIAGTELPEVFLTQIVVAQPQYLLAMQVVIVVV
jgi:hypothetical protein